MQSNYGINPTEVAAHEAAAERFGCRRRPAVVGSYIVWGSVRGWCGHAHRTLSGARRCLARDRAGCRRLGGFSDRAIYAVGADESAAQVADLLRADNWARRPEEVE